MILNSAQLREVWGQKKIPVVFRRGQGERLLLRLPYAPDNLSGVQAAHRHAPYWNVKYRYWETPARVVQ